MTASIETLTSLRERVLGGSGPDDELDCDILEALGIMGGPSNLPPKDLGFMLELTSSLDACRELQRRVLGDRWLRWVEERKGPSFYVQLRPLAPGPVSTFANHPDECRPWLGAILSALIAEAQAAEVGG